MITNDKISIYRYGYTLLIETFINFVLALLIGIVFDAVFSVIIFLAFFVPLRSFCGGWHAESSFGCTVISSMIVLFVTLIYKNQWLGDNYLPMVILDVICMFLIILCKPQDSKSKIKTLYYITIFHFMQALFRRERKNPAPNGAGFTPINSTAAGSQLRILPHPYRIPSADGTEAGESVRRFP